MAWTAHLDSFTKDPTNGNIVAMISFTDGTNTITRQVPGSNLDLPTVASFAGQFIAVLTARDAAFTTLATGVLTPPTETAAQLAADDFFAKLQTLRALNKAVADGFIAAAAPSIATAITAVQAAFLPAYLKDPRF